jgi:hypothetical protein
MPKLTIGTDDFREMRREDGYFVDKSMLIREVLDGSKCLLLPRPRRFGKTLNLSMLRYFFEMSNDDTRSMFDGLRIAEDADAMEHQGRYPVISTSLKDIKAPTWKGALEQMTLNIGELYLDFSEEVVPSLSPLHRPMYERLRDGKPTRGDLQNSLRNLISHLYQAYDTPVVVLIDEYDTPIIEAWNHGYYEEMVEFMRCWLGAGLKHENSAALYRALVTGIMRVAKESIFSGLNNLVTWTTLREGPFADKFGFTQDEVDEFLHDFDAQRLADPIREWYNGYDFGGTTIYNPWSVVNSIQGGMSAVQPYWLNTASNQLIYDELEAGGLTVKRDLEKLLKGEELRSPLSESITFADIGRSARNVWNFLYFSGYLRAQNPEQDLRGRQTYSLSIPNREVSLAYEQFIERVYTDATPDGLDALISCFLEDRPAENLQSVLQELVLSLISHHDLPRQAEAVFHAFVLGLLANLRNMYEIRSNAESGYGRADIIMRPTTDQYPLAFVIEFKSIEEDADPDKALDNALRQIKDRDYPAQLRSAGVAEENIRRLAVVLSGKKLRIRREAPH